MARMRLEKQLLRIAKRTRRSVVLLVKRTQKQAVRRYNQARRKALRKSKRGAKVTRKAVRNLMKSIRVNYKKHKDQDRNYRNRVRQIQKLARMHIRVGIVDGSASKGTLTVARVGTFHEFGLGVPRRSFIRDWYDPNVERIRARAARVSELVIAGTSSAEKGGNLLGAWAQGEIQQRISDGIGPALAAATIKRKKSDKQLIDTGQLRSSITFKVEFK
jgi:hypothetical protein